MMVGLLQDVAGKVQSALCDNFLESPKSSSAEDFLVHYTVSVIDFQNLPEPLLLEDSQSMCYLGGTFPSLAAIDGG